MSVWPVSVRCLLGKTAVRQLDSSETAALERKETPPNSQLQAAAIMIYLCACVRACFCIDYAE